MTDGEHQGSAHVSSRPLGAAGESVRDNVLRLRRARRFTRVELSERLTSIGRPIPVLGLSRIEAGNRRVDVDDLVALASIFGVSPAFLLAPPASCGTCGGAPPPGFICAECGAAPTPADPTP